MEDNTVETFIANLEGEISIREDLIKTYLDSGSKLYLMTRNVGTFLVSLGLLLYWLGYTHLVLSAAVVFLLTCIWVADYLDYSAKILIEMRLVCTLKDYKSAVTQERKYVKIADPVSYVATKLISLQEERVGATFVLESDMTKRAQELTKKVS
jgi:hypothetical protein